MCLVFFSAYGRRRSIVTSMASLALNSVLQNLSVGMAEKMKSDDSHSVSTASDDITMNESNVKTTDIEKGIENKAYQPDGDINPSTNSSVVDYNPNTTPTSTIHRSNSSNSTTILIRCNYDKK